MVMIMEETRYRVYNKTRYDIGITLENGMPICIRSGSFQLLKPDDIVYVDGICRSVKYFSKRYLVPYDSQGKEVSFEKMGANLQLDEHPHKSDEEIREMLKKGVKQIESWLSKIDDPVELHDIAEVAKTMDLTAGRLKVLQDKMPMVDFLEKEQTE